MNTRRLYMHYKAPVLLILISLTIFSCNRTSTIDPTQKDAFIKYYGGGSDQKAGQVIQTADGGYLVVGSSNSFKTTGDYDQYVVKVDVNGNVVWSKTFGDRGDDYARAVKLLPDGNYGIIGDRMIPGSDDKAFWSTMINFLKINDLGVLVNGPNGSLYGDTLPQSSARPRGRYNGNDITVTDNQLILFAGNTTLVDNTKNDYNISTDKTDGYVGKSDLNGNFLQRSVVGFPENDNLYSIFAFGANFYACGYTQKNSNDNVIVTSYPYAIMDVGLSSDYTHVNIQDVNTPNNPLSLEIQTTKDISILNDNSAYLLTGMRNNRPFIQKMNFQSGSILSNIPSVTFPFTSSQAQSNSIIQALDGNYIITGYTVNADANRDVFLAKINQSTGIVIWAKTFGGSSDDEGVDVKQTTDGGYIISANIGFGTNNNVIGLIKVKSDGTLK